VIRLTPCSCPDIAAIAGLDSSIGDKVVVLRAAWDPPAEVCRIVEILEQGVDVVQGYAGDAGEGWLFRFCQGFFRLVCRRVLGVDVPPTSSSLCGFSRRAVNAITRVKQKRPHLALLSCSVGLPRKTFWYQKIASSDPLRRRGLFSAVDRGIGMLVMHSASPLRFISYLGGFASVLNLLYVVYVLGVKLFKPHVAEGWTTLSLQNSLLFFFVFLCLILQAEYLGRILDETTEKPLYHFLDETGPSSIVGELSQRNVVEDSSPQREERHVA
jgi:hypothetical protein